MPSTRPRFRLRTLLLWVAFVAFYAAAMMNSDNYIWRRAALNVMVATLLVAGILAIALRGGEQRFAAGFTLTGWTYALVSSSGWVSEESLLTTQLSVWMHPLVAREMQGLRSMFFMPNANSFSTVGNSAWVLLIALLSGYFCRWVWERGRQGE